MPDVDVSPQNQTPRRMRSNADGSQTPYVALDADVAVELGEISQIAATNPAGTTMQNAGTGTGAGTPLVVTGYAEAIIEVTGTFVGTITLQASADGTNFTGGLNIVQPASGNPSANTITAAGVYRITVDGLSKVQANITAYTSGSITVKGYPAVQGAANQLQHIYQDTKNDATNDAISSYDKGYTPVNLTASGQILAAPGRIKGYTVNSYTATATVRIADNTAAGSGYLGAALTIAAVGYQEYPANVATGGYITISGTADITFFVRSGTQA